LNAVAERYHELGLCYQHASQKLWKTDPSDWQPQPDHLVIPALNCLALGFEISFKGVLVAKGEDPESFQDRYGHKLIKLWNHCNMKRVREETEAQSVFWSYPASWPGEGSTFHKFQKHFQWLNDAFSGQADYKKTLIFRYPTGKQTKFIPPDFMIQAADTILGIVEQEIQEAENSTC
jgi:hypothetical protein